MKNIHFKHQAPYSKKISALCLSLSLLIGSAYIPIFAESEKAEITGQFFEFDSGNTYDFNSKEGLIKPEEAKTYGNFFIQGNISAVNNKEGIPCYEVEDGNLTFFYNYGDSLLKADTDEWHLTEDKSKSVGDIKLDSDIRKGALIVQTSRNRKNWINAQTICNAFSETPVRTDAVYTTTDIQLLDGCYYRFIVAYETAVRTEESSILFINRDKYDHKKYAEVYEFYAASKDGMANAVNTDQTFSLGEKVRVKNFDSYSGAESIGKGDPHYGWDLGNFFVSGYTDKTVDSEDNPVFLKNVGDKVTLWFRLNQDINKLNGKDNLSITADKEGYDQYFETPKMEFGKGVLITRFTDHNNVKSEPTYYTKYLEANATTNEDTKVQLFEEGNYEVALDYEVTKDELLDKVGHYRIFFKFSVRNGNCMVYPFDTATGGELSNSSITENGFRLDLAKSKYLKINLKKEILKDSADGLVEDTRFNGPAKDGAEYTDEGIYTITVNNPYTGQVSTKKIYVGTNDILKAAVTMGMPVSDVKNLIAEGATISEDGTLQLSSVQSAQEQVSPVSKKEETSKMNPAIWAIIAAGLLLLAGAIVFWAKKYKASNTAEDTFQSDLPDNKGGKEK